MKKNRSIYFLAAGLVLFTLALAYAALVSVSGVPHFSLGAIGWIWAGGAVVLAAVIAFFIGLILKGK